MMEVVSLLGRVERAVREVAKRAGYDLWLRSEKDGVRVSVYDEEKERVVARAELAWSKLTTFGWSFTGNGMESASTLSFHLPHIALYLTAERARWKGLNARLGFPGYSHVRTGVELYRINDEWVFTYSFLHNDDDSQYTSRKWWRPGYHVLADVVFGQTSFEKSVLWKGPVSIPLPEGVYTGTGSLTEHTQRKPRWPGVWQRFYRENVDVPQGVDHGGKHSTLFGMSPAARSYRGPNGAYDAVGAFVGDVMEKRDGDPSWKPRTRVRRILPFADLDPFGAALYEMRDTLTGKWENRLRITKEFISTAGYEVSEDGCGCCAAKYGEACVDPKCPNICLRRENFPDYIVPKQEPVDEDDE